MNQDDIEDFIERARLRSEINRWEAAGRLNMRKIRELQMRWEDRRFGGPGSRDRMGLEGYDD